MCLKDSIGQCTRANMPSTCADMPVHMCKHVCSHVQICLSTCVNMPVHMCKHACPHVQSCLFTYASMSVYIYKQVCCLLSIFHSGSLASCMLCLDLCCVTSLIWTKGSLTHKEQKESTPELQGPLQLPRCISGPGLVPNSTCTFPQKHICDEI